jgi:SAM-dependent methyltransferase
MEDNNLRIKTDEKSHVPLKILKSASKCRFCNNVLEYSVVDLGMSPPCERFIKPENVNDSEKFYPLHAYICHNCWLMQLEELVTPAEIFANEYPYFSSYSTSWVEHARRYSEKMIEGFGFDSHSFVVEIASNDGYLLQWFHQKGIPVLGVNPAANIAVAARFFGYSTAVKLSERYGKANLLIGNNVLAHVPDVNDFVKGMKRMLAPKGLITMEFPHLQRLIEGNQFDTIYHEHFSYLSFIAVNRIFAYHGITLFDVEELSTHGGSIRIFGKHADDDSKEVTNRVDELLQRELDLGFETLEYYSLFEEKVKETKRKLLDFLIQAKREGKTVAGYGAPGKGNTLLTTAVFGLILLITRFPAFKTVVLRGYFYCIVALAGNGVNYSICRGILRSKNCDVNAGINPGILKNYKSGMATNRKEYIKM